MILAVGDIQGCLDELEALLAQVRFDPARDRLWLVGDLVNRGPKSLETLRFVRKMNALSVLGNHDLFLLACFAGVRRPPPELAPVLDAPEAEALCDWLRRCPLVHREEVEGASWALVHAGLSPRWDWDTIEGLARAIEARLQGDGWRDFLARAFAEPAPEVEPEDEEARLLFALSVFTRARYCTADGRFDWTTRAGGPASRAFAPWDRHPARWKGNARVIFGHWAARGPVLDSRDVLGLDGGCVWGGRLVAARLLAKGGVALQALSCPGYCTPGT